MGYIKTLIAILQGKAVVLIKSTDNKADVLVGRSLTRQFAINSMVGAVNAMML
jgi:hypothetical protein